MTRHAVTLLLFCSLLQRYAMDQEKPAEKLSVESAVKLAVENLPAIRAARARAKAAEAGVQLARTSYLPKLDMVWQENRASRNNVFGLLLPQSTIPPISGPVLGTTSMASAWGSAGGMLFSWEPFDFGARKAYVQAARGQLEAASRDVDLNRLEASATAADAFFALASAEQAAAAATANVERLKAFSTSVHALVDSQLRPGADASRADAELAAGRNLLILAQRESEVARATLAESLGKAGEPVTIDVAAVPPPPNEGLLLQTPPESHPLAREQFSVVSAASSREHALARSYYPHLNAQFALYGRGSGALLDGRIDPTQGLAPDVPNWAAGISLTFPAFDFFGIRARRRTEQANEAGETARYDQVIQGLRAQNVRARAVLDAALKFAANTPVQLQAAKETHTLARARYAAGLATIVEVADAQRLLAQAETDDAVARINVWRALLAEARAGGDLTPFLRLMAAGRPAKQP